MAQADAVTRGGSERGCVAVRIVDVIAGGAYFLWVTRTNADRSSHYYMVGNPPALSAMDPDSRDNFSQATVRELLGRSFNEVEEKHAPSRDALSQLIGATLTTIDIEEERSMDL